VAFGPPIVNIEKLLALVRAGLLDVANSATGGSGSEAREGYRL
jgi:hypothetical protein